MLPGFFVYLSNSIQDEKSISLYYSFDFVVWLSSKGKRFDRAGSLCRA
jgi:hypothetical protein